MQGEALRQLAVSLGLGLLVGLQREWSASRPAGIRTFALIPLLGTVAAMVSEELGTWLVPAGVLALAGILGLHEKRNGGEAGFTTKIAALVMYGVGALLVVRPMSLGVLVGGSVALLLQWKEPLHRIVDRIGEKDIRAIFQLVLIALVILPVLPNRTYGPYDVLNPFRIWLMVVLIVGISVGGYLLHKVLGSRSGTLLAGVLGGVISSTATTVSYARRLRTGSGAVRTVSWVIALASTVAFARVLLAAGLVARGIVPDVAPPMIAMMLWMALVCAIYARTLRGEMEAALREHENPAELRPALLFAGLYAVILFGVAAANQHFGERGLYYVSLISGLTDMDAITLSTAEMIASGRVAVSTGWRMILLGGLSNIVFKLATAGVLGGRRLFLAAAVPLGLSLAGGIVILFFWPG